MSSKREEISVAITRNPVIFKARLSRSATTAAVRKAATNAESQRRNVRDLSSDSFVFSYLSDSLVVTQMKVMQIEFAKVKSIQKRTSNVLEEIKERLEAIESNVPRIPTDPSPRTNHGLNASLDLDVAHFIKLIFTKKRLKDQANADITNNVFIDDETEKTSIINKSNVQYEKQFSDY